MKKDKKKDKPANKTPELSKAKKALDAYLKENNLDPQKDWSKDKKHGKKVTELLNKLNKERDKVAAQYPEKDLKNEAKLVKMKKAKEDEKASKKKEKKEKNRKHINLYCEDLTRKARGGKIDRIVGRDGKESKGRTHRKCCSCKEGQKGQR